MRVGPLELSSEPAEISRALPGLGFLDHDLPLFVLVENNSIPIYQPQFLGGPLDDRDPELRANLTGSDYFYCLFPVPSK